MEFPTSTYMTAKDVIKMIDGVFMLPKKVTYFGKLKHGTPYFWPMGFNKNIISVRRLKLANADNDKRFTNLPMVRRSKNWIKKIFGRYYYIKIGWPISVKRIRLGWKDKFDSPRFEFPPAFQVNFFGLQFQQTWVAPDGDNDTYYEMILWYLFYSDRHIKKAEDTWGWMDYKTKESTWKDEYLRNHK